MSHVSMTQTLRMLGEHLDTTRIEHDRMSILFRCNLNLKEVQLSVFAEKEKYSRTCEHASPMTAPKSTHAHTHCLACCWQLAFDIPIEQQVRTGSWVHRGNSGTVQAQWQSIFANHMQNWKSGRFLLLWCSPLHILFAKSCLLLLCADPLLFVSLCLGKAEPIQKSRASSCS